MILDSTSLKLEAVLAGAVSANQPEVTVDYVAYPANSGEVTKPATTRTALSGNTDVTILAAPGAANTVLEPIFISIYNKDTASVTVTVKTDNGTTERIICKVTLLTLETLIYEKGSAWYALTAAGGFKQGGISGPASSTNNGIVRWNGTTGTIIQDSTDFTYDGTTVTIGASKFTVTASSGNTLVGGTLSVTGHTTFEGVTSTGATGTGNLVYSASPSITGSLTVGASAASAGLIRVPNNNPINARNAAGNGDVNLIYLDGSNIIQFGGTINITGTLTASAIASSGAAQTGYLCYNTSGGVVTYDGGATCLVSREEYKEDFGRIDGPMEIISKLRPFWGAYRKDSPMSDKRTQPFLGSRHTGAVDMRLVSVDKKGKPLGVRYDNMTALLIAALQEQQKRIKRLEARR